MTQALSKQALAQSHPRPFATYYYASVRDATKDWSKIGRAGSLRGAIRAAVGHIIDGKYSSCEIYNMDTNLFNTRVFLKGKSIVISNIYLIKE